MPAPYSGIRTLTTVRQNRCVASSDIRTRVGDRELSLSNLDKVLYPLTGYTKAEVVNYYVSRLRPEWSPEVERSLAGAAGTTTQRSYRVTFSREDQCLILGTAGMVADLAQPVYTLSAYGREGDSC